MIGSAKKSPSGGNTVRGDSKQQTRKSSKAAILLGVSILFGLAGCADPTGAFQATPTLSREIPAVTVNPKPSQTADQNTPAADEISAEEAQEIALAHANLSAAEATFINAHLDHDDGRLHYEVEFYSSNTEYDYDIDAKSGEIIGFDTDIEDFVIDKGQRPQVKVSEQEAKKTALAKVPGATEADIRIHLEYDDGQPEYSGSIVYQEMEYEFEINAATGAIIEWEVESVYDD